MQTIETVPLKSYSTRGGSSRPFAPRLLGRRPRLASLVHRRRFSSDASAGPKSVLPPPDMLVPRETGVEHVAEPFRLPHDADGALTQYMRHVGEVGLITPQQEIELAARIRQGDESARDHMIRANLRLVIKIAREYDGLGLPLLDLINEGNIGLMKAVERFDPAKGGKLSTYGSWWIKQSIRRAIANQSKTIRLPVHVTDLIWKIRKAERRLHDVLDRDPTDAEIAAEMGMSVPRVSEIRQASVRTASLDAPLGDDDTSRLGDVVQDENAANPFTEAEERVSTDLVMELIKKLNARESTILKLRFGLDNGREITLEELGRKFGVTRERIRQLQNAALAKLRRMIEKLDHMPVVAV
jgi:RNA polymerase primary sigma factor